MDLKLRVLEGFSCDDHHSKDKVGQVLVIRVEGRPIDRGNCGEALKVISPRMAVESGCRDFRLWQTDMLGKCGLHKQHRYCTWPKVPKSCGFLARHEVGCLTRP